MISISKTANQNYLAKIVELKGIVKHSNADKLQIVNVDFQPVIIGLEAKEGDIYVYFPVESTLNKDLLSFMNAFRDKELNADKEQTGFFEAHARIKAIKLRGEKSMGYIIPVATLEAFTKQKGLSEFVGKEFDTVNGVLILQKYIVPSKQQNNVKQGKTPKISRLIEGQVRLHVDTENLRKNIVKINPEDEISVTYKTHGTSWWAGNLLVKKPLNLLERLLLKIGIDINTTQYDVLYGSRNVVKNQHVLDPKAKDEFYGYDIWLDIKNKLTGLIPEGFTLYGECIGYDKNGQCIQPGYDYGCAKGEFKIEVYRITQTNINGYVTELSYAQINEFCKHFGLNPPYLHYSGKAKYMYPEIELNDKWHENMLRRLEADYNEKDCFMCTNKNPEEGIVLRKESLFSCESYKLKSFAFLERETKDLDSGKVGIE